MKTYLQRISDYQSLTENEMKEAAHSLFLEGVSDSEIAAFLMGLKIKGETVEEITGLVRVLREKSLTFQRPPTEVMDNCGTGGDGSNSFNISTTVSFVLAGAGVTVAKHGNRSISSKSGSADVLEQLGVNIHPPKEVIEALLHEVGIAFLFAPAVHPHLKGIMKVRKDLRIPTIFNLIGPLTNPFELDYQLLGLYRQDLLEVFAQVLNSLGRKRAIVLNGAGSMDEASLQGENQLVLLDGGIITNMTLHPEEVGLSVYPNESIRGGDANHNADILRSVLKGEKGAYRDTVLLNAGIGLFAAAKVDTIQEGVKLATESIDSKAALGKLEELIFQGSRMSKGAM